MANLIKNKKTLLALIAIVLGIVWVICAAAASAAISSNYRDFQKTLGRLSQLTTTRDPDRYAVFKADKNTVSVYGRYAGEVVADFIVNSSGGLKSEKKSVKANGDGSFNITYTAKNTSAGSATAFITLKSGGYIKTRLEFDEGGFFFGDNGIAKSAADLYDNIRTADPQTCLLYIDDNLDERVIAATLDAIRAKASEITDGIDSEEQKAKLISAWVADNIYYEDAESGAAGGVDLSTIALKNVWALHRTVCGGYSNLCEVMLQSVGIKTVHLSGGVVSPGKCSYEQLAQKTVVHEWLAFYSTEQQHWVTVDPTWDSGNTYSKGEAHRAAVASEYFEITPELLSQTHRADTAESRDYFGAFESLQKKKEKFQTEVEVSPFIENTAAPVPQDSEESEQYSETAAAGADSEIIGSADKQPTVILNSPTLIFTVINVVIVVFGVGLAIGLIAVIFRNLKK